MTISTTADVNDNANNQGFQALMKLGWPQRLDKRGLSSTGVPILAATDTKKQVFSDDPKMLAMKNELREKLNALAQPEIDALGFPGANALASDFSALQSVSGYKASPLSFTLVDNSVLAEEYDLATGFLSHRHEKIFSELHDVMFCEYRESNLAVKKIAGSGLPHLTTSIVDKKILIMRFMKYFLNASKKRQSIATMLEKGHFVDMFLQHQLFFTHLSGLRVSPEGGKFSEHGVFIPKPREINTLEYALSGGTRGERKLADKSCYKDGNKIENAAAFRTRLVWGAPCAPNYFIAAVFTLFREYYLNEYEYSFKHRTRDEVLQKVKKFSLVVGADVKAYDTTIQPFLIDKFVKSFEGKVNDSFVKLLQTMFHMPYLQTNPIASEDNKAGPCTIVGNPFNPSDFSLNMGLPSGIACNPDCGKFIATATYLCLLDDHFHDVLEVGIASILKGECSTYALLDASDDVLIQTNDESFVSFFDTFTTSGKPYYLKIAREQGVSFLGNIYYKDAKGELNASPNIVTWIVNTLCNERGIDSKSRRFHYIGHYDRLEHYSPAPLFHDVYSLWDETQHKYFGESLNMRSAWWKAHDPTPVATAYTEIDREVQFDPDKLFWKFSANDVHPDILNEIISVIEFDVFWPFLKQIFH